LAASITVEDAQLLRGPFGSGKISLSDESTFQGGFKYFKIDMSMHQMFLSMRHKKEMIPLVKIFGGLNFGKLITSAKSAKFSLTTVLCYMVLYYCISCIL